MDKTDRLFEAIEHPERFTDDELNRLLSDPEISELYSTMSKANTALSEVPSPDVDKEWARLEKSIRKRPLIMTFANRHAAAIFISVLVSVAAVAAAIGITATLRQENKEHVTTTTDRNDSIQVTAHHSIGVAPTKIGTEIVEFENQPLDSILDRIATFYNVKVQFRNPEARNLRLQFKWDEALSLKETLDMLNNFEQFNIYTDSDTIIVE